jgi:hypothetical protein
VLVKRTLKGKSMRDILILITAACLTSSGNATQLTVSGVAADCVGGKRLNAMGIDVYALDAAKTPELLNLLKALANEEPNPDDSRSVQRFFERYDRLARLIKTSPKLAHTKTDKSGRFSLAASGNATNLIVVGYAESADGPPSYAYAQATAGSQSAASLILEFTHGHCGK